MKPPSIRKKKKRKRKRCLLREFVCYDYVGKVCAFFFSLCLLDFLRWDPVVLQSGERDDVDGFGW